MTYKLDPAVKGLTSKKFRGAKFVHKSMLLFFRLVRDAPLWGAPQLVGTYCCWMPAMTQPPAPLIGRVRCQISVNGAAGRSSSRIMPVKRTLTTC